MNKEELIDFGFFVAMYPFWYSGTPEEVIPNAHWIIRVLDKDSLTYDPELIFKFDEEFKIDYKEVTK